jgi:hypothetical protein
MIAKDVMRIATIEGGQEIRPSYALQWIGNAMRILAQKFDTACVINEEPIIVELKAGEWHKLPPTCYGINNVTRGSEVYRAFTTDTYNRVTFSEDGTYTIEWLRPAVTPTDVDYEDELEIHEMYLDSIAKYVSAKNKISIGVELDIAAKAEQDFWKDAIDVDTRLKRVKRANNRVPAREWK